MSLKLHFLLKLLAHFSGANEFCFSSHWLCRLVPLVARLVVIELAVSVPLVVRGNECFKYAGNRILQCTGGFLAEIIS